MKHIGIYPLSADPIHKGHIDIISKICNSRIFNEIIVALGNNDQKNYLFNPQERLELARRSLPSGIQVEHYDGLLRDYALSKGKATIIRSIRSANDYEYERTMTEFHRQYGLETIFINSDPKYSTFSSTLVKSLATEGVLVHPYVTPVVKQALEEKVQKKVIIGITGNMGCGKTTFCRSLKLLADKSDIKLHHIDLDSLVHEVYNKNGPLYEDTRNAVVQIFGEDILSGTDIDRRKMSKIVFSDDEKRLKLAYALKAPVTTALEEKIRGLEGFILLDAAYLAEYNMLDIVNNNIILLSCDRETRKQRIMQRDKMDLDDIEKHFRTQFSTEKIKETVLNAIKVDHHGRLYEVDTSTRTDYQTILKDLHLFKQW